MEKIRFLEIKCLDDETGRTVHIEDTTKTNPHMVFYRADDVDALLDDVRALVEAAKVALQILPLYGYHEQIENFKEAIAAVERHL